jgi:hypothetical protein
LKSHGSFRLSHLTQFHQCVSEDFGWRLPSYALSECSVYLPISAAILLKGKDGRDAYSEDTKDRRAQIVERDQERDAPEKADEKQESVKDRGRSFQRLALNTHGEAGGQGKRLYWSIQRGVDQTESRAKPAIETKNLAQGRASYQLQKNIDRHGPTFSTQLM